MKRLVKKSEFYDGDKLKDLEIYVFKNPTRKERRDICSQCSLNMARLFIHKNGDIYAWRGDILHEVIEGKYPKLVSLVDMLYDMDSSEVTFYIKPGINDASELANYIIAAQSNLNNSGINNNSEIDELNSTYYKAQNDEAYAYFRTLNDIIEYGLDDNSKVHQIINDKAS